MSLEPLDFRNTNSLWCSVLVETLARCGIREAVISPGSRSTPLTFALVRHSAVECIPILDERSAAFFALGLAKQHRRPVVLVCTSGTAGANYFPAIIEAQESHVPLIVITADRPPEMRECASGQTIDQLRLFGSHVNWFHELAVPEASLGLLRYLRQTTAHAVERALRPSSGPIHLNAPFRDPLPPIPNDSAKGVENAINEEFFSHLQPIVAGAPDASLLYQKATTTRGLIVAGGDSPADPKAYATSILKLSEALGWPILADALSPLRHYTEKPGRVIAGYDAILRSEKVARDLVPRAVLCLGGWPTSKVLRGWLESSGAEIALVSPHAENRDALHGRTRHIVAHPKQLAAEGSSADETYANLWRSYEERVQRSFDNALAVDELVEPRVTRELPNLVPAGTALFVASSMPVRDVEYFWPVTAKAVRLYFNRGANGIDGTLSSALGVAHGGMPAVLLTGDLALLHDTNGFLQAEKFRGSLTIILINNDGGGIFQHLPVAQFDPPFETYFATPQRVDFAQLCSAYHIEHIDVKTWKQFRELLGALPATGIRLLELKTDRKRDAAFRKNLFARTAAEAEKP